MDLEAHMNTTIEISYAILSGEKIAPGIHGEATSVSSNEGALEE